jgi:hypothetical protein
LCTGTVDGHEDTERHQAQDQRDGDDGAHGGGQPAGRPGPPEERLRPERLGSRRSFITGQPGEDREQGPEPGLAVFQSLAVSESAGSDTARKRAIVRVVQEVAAYLGNTPAVARPPT